MFYKQTSRIPKKDVDDESLTGITPRTLVGIQFLFGRPRLLGFRRPLGVVLDLSNLFIISSSVDLRPLIVTYLLMLNLIRSERDLSYCLFTSV